MTVHANSARGKAVKGESDANIIFFEIAGQPGTMYLDNYSFGGTAPWGKWADEEGISMDGHASTTYMTERAGPLHIFPTWKSLFHSPLCGILRDSVNRHSEHVYHTPNAHDEGILPTCSMGIEVPTRNGALLKTTKYRFIDPVVINYYPMKDHGREAFTISYKDYRPFNR
ncbi:MAG: hypothetical protein ABI878_12215 [Acidobacteriota bacterium]